MPRLCFTQFSFKIKTILLQNIFDLYYKYGCKENLPKPETQRLRTSVKEAFIELYI